MGWATKHPLSPQLLSAPSVVQLLAPGAVFSDEIHGETHHKNSFTSGETHENGETSWRNMDEWFNHGETDESLHFSMKIRLSYMFIFMEKCSNFTSCLPAPRVHHFFAGFQAWKYGFIIMDWLSRLLYEYTTHRTPDTWWVMFFLKQERLGLGRSKCLMIPIKLTTGQPRMNSHPGWWKLWWFPQITWFLWLLSHGTPPNEKQPFGVDINPGLTLSTYNIFLSMVNFPSKSHEPEIWAWSLREEIKKPNQCPKSPESPINSQEIPNSPHHLITHCNVWNYN